MCARRLLAWAYCCLSIVEFATAQVNCATAAEGTICNDAEGCGCYDAVCSKPDYEKSPGTYKFDDPKLPCGTTYSVSTPCAADEDECVTSVAGHNSGCTELGLAGFCTMAFESWLCLAPHAFATTNDGDACDDALSGSCECFQGLCVLPGASGHCVFADDPGVVGDPHMQGLRGQKIDWHGVDSGWYSLIKDDIADLNINVRLTAPLLDEFPDRQLITSLAVMSEGQSLVIEIENPYTIDTNGCPEGISPCLANGGLRIFVDGQVADELLQFSRGVQLADGAISLSASNLPVECRQFGGDKIWARMYQEMLEGTRELESDEILEEWILSSGHTMAAPDWCTKYIAENSLVDLQSTHAIFKIETPTVTVRLNAGVNFQGGGQLDWDGRVLPDLEFWQMDVGMYGLDIMNPALSGLLGETARPLYAENGSKVMEGSEAFRGTVEDYRVSSALGVHFPLLDKNGDGHRH